MSTVVIRPSSDYSIGTIGYNGGATTASYTWIDETSPSTTDYNYRLGVSSGTDLFGFSDHGQSTGVVNSVAITTYSTTQGNKGTIQNKVYLSGTTYDFDTAYGPFSGWNTVTKTLSASPRTEKAWTWDEITNAKFGYLLTASTSSKYVIIAQMYITIDYTLPPPKPSYVTASKNNSAQVNLSWSSGGADGPTTGYYVYRSGSNFTTVAGTSAADTGAAAPTITPGSTVASNGSSTEHIALSLSGTTNNNGTQYYYQVIAYGPGGNSAASDINNPASYGYRVAGTLTYQWQRSSGTGDSDYSSIAGATSSTYNDTAAPAPTITPGSAVATFGEWTNRIELSNPGISNNNGEQRYYRCYLTASPATAQYSAANAGYRSAGTSACQWQMSAGDTDENYLNISGATAEDYTYIWGPNDKHYFRLAITASPAASASSTPTIGRRSNGSYLFHG